MKSASLLLLLLIVVGCASKPELSPAVQLDHGGIIRGDTSRKTLALVFTGGDYAEGVPTILRVCKAHKIPAAFFVTGDFLREHRDAADAIIAADQSLGPHSDRHLLYCDWSDRSKSLVTEAEFKDDLRRNLADLRQFRARPRFFLPPFEWFNEDQVRWAKDLGLTLINFTPGSGSNRDYIPESDPKFTPSAKIAAGILAYEQKDPHGLNGFILLLHAGSLRTDKMTDQLDRLVTQIEERGYTFVSLDQLLRR